MNQCWRNKALFFWVLCYGVSIKVRGGKESTNRKNKNKIS